MMILLLHDFDENQTLIQGYLVLVAMRDQCLSSDIYCAYRVVSPRYRYCRYEGQTGHKIRPLILCTVVSRQRLVAPVRDDRLQLFF